MKKPTADTTINIEISVANGEPCAEHLSAILLALIHSTVSVAKKMDATNPYAAADVIRDEFLRLWKDTPIWPEDE